MRRYMCAAPKRWTPQRPMYYLCKLCSQCSSQCPRAWTIYVRMNVYKNYINSYKIEFLKFCT